MKVQLRIKTEMGRMYARPPSDLAVAVPQPMPNEGQEQYMQRLQAHSEELRKQNTRIIQMPVYLLLETELEEDEIKQLEDDTYPPDIDPKDFTQASPWQLPNGLVCTGMEVIRCDEEVKCDKDISNKVDEDNG